MLGKLFKYEMKATGRTFWPVYVAVLVLAAINGFFLSGTISGDAYNHYNQIGTPQAISISIYIFLMAAMAAITMIVIIQRFYRNFLGDEGYLMFTLPAKTSQLIFSKVLTSSAWYVLSGLVAILSILLIAVTAISWEQLMQLLDISVIIEEIKFIFYTAAETLGMPTWLFCLELVIIGILSLFSTVLMIYAAISMGHLFQKSRKLAAFASFVVLMILIQIVSTFLGEFNIFGFSTFIFTTDLTYNEPSHLSFIWSILLSLAECAFFYFICRFILSKKLNLE